MPLDTILQGIYSYHYESSFVQTCVAVVCLGWYIFIVLVSTLGTIQLKNHFSSPPAQPVSTSLPISSVPYVTIIRPVKGLDSDLYACLASTFYQNYPPSHLRIYFCVSSKSDPAIKILKRLLADFPNFDAHILVEDNDPLLQGPEGNLRLGPNPKIRNMSRAYREAKGDIIWVLDCNVWVGNTTAGRMVDRLEGFDGRGGFKFVHLLPLVVDTSPLNPQGVVVQSETSQLLEPQSAHELHPLDQLGSSYGAQLEEAFFSSSHAKFYSAINTVLVAPCVVGKSNMYHKSHLDSLTPPSSASNPPRAKGMDYFSDFICEDHLIGDMLWKDQVTSERGSDGKRMGKHSLVYGSLAVQPIAHMAIGEYIARRVRWLRVRKFTVILATLVEPGTESMLCSLFGAYGLTTVLPATPLPLLKSHYSNSWVAFVLVFFTGVTLWMQVDRYVYLLLHSGATIEPDEANPYFAKGAPLKSYGRWARSWIGRELLACPIWTWAFWFGTKVVWRGQRFKVGVDMRVRPCSEDDSRVELGGAHGSGKTHHE
ncbi:MAG: hypothetical protein M1814_000398 [Vezdaea aestivalis]|nr:MAG: hypothetical protein M1814_000398 [Vezdaea aestivalis]